MNRRLQQTLNVQEAHVARGEQRFGLQDKVMQVRNNYEKQVFKSIGWGMSEPQNIEQGMSNVQVWNRCAFAILILNDRIP